MCFEDKTAVEEKRMAVFDPELLVRIDRLNILMIDFDRDFVEEPALENGELVNQAWDSAVAAVMNLLLAHSGDWVPAARVREKAHWKHGRYVVGKPDDLLSHLCLWGAITTQLTDQRINAFAATVLGERWWAERWQGPRWWGERWLAPQPTYVDLGRP